MKNQISSKTFNKVPILKPEIPIPAKIIKIKCVCLLSQIVSLATLNTTRNGNINGFLSQAHKFKSPQKKITKIPTFIHCVFPVLQHQLTIFYLIN